MAIKCANAWFAAGNIKEAQVYFEDAFKQEELLLQIPGTGMDISKLSWRVRIYKAVMVFSI